MLLYIILSCLIKKQNKNKCVGKAIIPVMRRLRQEDCFQFKVDQNDNARPCLKKQKA